MTSAAAHRLFIVGNPDPIHVGAHLLSAARELGQPTTFFDTNGAFSANQVVNKISWALRGHRPARLRQFGAQVAQACRDLRPRWMLATGIAPLDAATLRTIGSLGIERLNYLTDDPWNPSHRAPWFMDALRQYDRIYSTRRSNLDDLATHGCKQVIHVPFGYAPSVHHDERPEANEGRAFRSDVVFAGGADPDRVPLVASLIGHGFDVALYGGYWERFPETRGVARGHADPQALRKAICGSRVSLCLVRRANRDGSAMRTFEVAAMGACMLVEDTVEHRDIFGSDLEAVAYFSTPNEMVDRLRWLLTHDDERARLGAAVRDRITHGRHTYKDRLETMLAAATRSTSPS